MAGMFISLEGMAEFKRAEARTNACNKREGLSHHPIRAVVCGCGPDCGGFYITDTSVDMRTIQLKRGSPSSVERECHHFK